MRDILGSGTILGYCTNVHAGDDWTQTKVNLERHAVRVKEIVSPNTAMGIGLWFSAKTAEELLQNREVESLREWLSAHGLIAYTLNGFPYGDFHQPIVKQAVYEPDWRTSSRLSYTTDLANILCTLLNDGDEGSISTLPIGWLERLTNVDAQQQAASNLRTMVERLHRLFDETGRLIHLNLEPEPLCMLGKSADLVRFFENWLLRGSDDERVLRHLRVCHDVCHAAVMADDQQEAFRRYNSLGIAIGKVQLSSAIRCDMRGRSSHERLKMLSQLRTFCEDRYLHQTFIGNETGGTLLADLPEALNRYEQGNHAGDEWRVHFHVPIYLKEIGLLQTTQDSIVQCMQLLSHAGVKHWEVETYAWDVLPDELKVADLAEGIARELMWVKEQAAKIA